MSCRRSMVDVRRASPRSSSLTTPRPASATISTRKRIPPISSPWAKEFSSLAVRVHRARFRCRGRERQNVHLQLRAFRLRAAPRSGAAGWQWQRRLRYSAGKLAQPDAKTESLGRQMIEGVQAEGTQSTMTIAAGDIGNELPISSVSERWYSPELQTVIMSKRSDPRFGETTYHLMNIQRGEQPATLFEVPSDYTITEGPPMPKMIRTRETAPEVK